MALVSLGRKECYVGFLQKINAMRKTMEFLECVCHKKGDITNWK
jgi:hypothetical protein